MMRASFAEQRQRAEFAASDLVDLSWTPWRRIMLSSRDNVWTLVDAEDFAWLSQNIWNVSFGGGSGKRKLYAKRNVDWDRKTIRMHREIMIRADPRSERFMADHHVDHGNGQGLDNRRANLSWATPKQNAANRLASVGLVPSLDSIVLQLLSQLGPRPEIQEMPF